MPERLAVPEPQRPGQSNKVDTPTESTTTVTRDSEMAANTLDDATGLQQHHQYLQQEEAADAGQREQLTYEADMVQPLPFSWTKGKLIGAGAFGRVFQGLHNHTGEFIAVKQVGLTKDEALKGRIAEHIKALEAEVCVLKHLRNENIVQYLGTERTEECLNIFLEYVPGGSIASLLDKFGPLQETVIRIYTKQILRGLEYLHQKKIMHRDIKGANILVDKRGTVKLADFGASKRIEDLATIGSGSKSIRGTPYWMAPEVIKQTGHGRPADIWSLGCVVIEMATGKPPWSNCHTQVAAMFHIASTKDPPPLPDCLSAEARDFLVLCFNRVPKERPNASRLLKHPWMANITVPTSSTPPPPAVTAAAMPPRTTPLPLPAARSPPSPIKEEPESVRSPAVRSPHEQAGPAPSNHTRPPNVPPLPLNNLNRGSVCPPRQPSPAATPPPAQAPYRQQNSSTQHASPAAPALVSTAAPPSTTQNYRAIAQPEQFDSLIGMDSLPDSNAAVQSSVQLQPSMRGSVMLSINYNPMEEPSWMPSQQAPALKKALAAIRENEYTPASVESASPRTQLAGGGGVGPPQATATPRSPRVGRDDMDTGVQLDQPEQVDVEEVKLQDPDVGCDVGGRDPVRESKMQKWRDELFAELENKRQQQKQARASMGVGVLGSTTSFQVPVASSRGGQ